MKLAFTDKALRGLSPPLDKPQAFYFDSKTTGLQYVLGKGGTGTFYAVYHRLEAGDRVKVREVLGRYPELTLPEAKKALALVLGRVAEAKPTPGDVRRNARSGSTLKEATTDYLTAMKNDGCRPSSMDTVEREMLDAKRAYVRTWLERPLASITARECIDLHAKIGLEHGKHVANRVMRQLSAIWNRQARIALAEGQQWPANPITAVQPFSGNQPGYRRRRREPIGWDALPAWRVALDELTSVRRDYNLVVLLTGLRRTDACTLRWEHVNLTAEVTRARVWDVSTGRFEIVALEPAAMLRPLPKGGAEHAFTVPLSKTLVEILVRRKEENATLGANDGGWVFPAKAGVRGATRSCSMCAELGLPAHVPGGVIHMVEPKEDDAAIVSPHRLRDTYLTATEEVEIPEGAAKCLVNHALPTGSVTMDYRRPALGLLRQCQEKISGFLLAKMTPPPTERHLRSVS